jgi:hypothetical protein
MKHILRTVSLIALAVLSQRSAAQTPCEEVPHLPPLPCGQDDFERGNLFITNVNIVGHRLFTAEDDPNDQENPKSDLMAGSIFKFRKSNDNLFPCQNVLGNVAIAWHPKIYPTRWTENTNLAVNDERIPAIPMRFVYKVTNPNGGNTGPFWDAFAWKGAPGYKNGKNENKTITQTIKAIIVDDKGAGYDPFNPPTITITPDQNQGSGATAEPVIENGKIVRIRVTNCGSGYSLKPTATVTGGTFTTPASIKRVDIERDPYLDESLGWTVVRRDLTPMWTAERGISHGDRNAIMRPSNGNHSTSVDPVFRIVDVKGLSGATSPNFSADKVGDNTDVNGDNPRIVWERGWSYYLARPYSQFHGQTAVKWVYNVSEPDFVAANGRVYRIDDILVTGTQHDQNNPPNWSAIPDDFDRSDITGTTLVHNGIRWACVGIDGSSFQEWQANTRYSHGTYIKPPNFTIPKHGFRMHRASEVFTATGTVANEPNWASITDQFDENGIIWKRVGVDAADVDFRATGRVILSHGFRVQKGARLHAYIKPRVESLYAMNEDWNYTDVTDMESKWERMTDKLGVEAIQTPSQVEMPPGSGPKTLQLKSTFSPNSEGIPFQVSQVRSKHGFGPYGLFEARCKTPSSKGTFTSFWMANCCGPNWWDNGVKKECIEGSTSDDNFDEIDVFERADWYGGARQGHHCPDFTAQTAFNWGNATTANGTGVFSGIDLYDFHNYSIEWMPGVIRWLVDGKVVKRLPEKGGHDYARNMTGRPVNILLHNHSSPICDHSYSSTHEVEWVRIRDFKSQHAPKIALGDAEKKVRLSDVDAAVWIAPNPTLNGTITLGFDPDGVAARVNIVIFDVLGNVVQHVYEGPVSQLWKKEVTFDAAVSEGVYYAVFQIYTPQGQTVVTRKVQLIR